MLCSVQPSISVATPHGDAQLLARQSALAFPPACILFEMTGAVLLACEESPEGREEMQMKTGGSQTSDVLEDGIHPSTHLPLCIACPSPYPLSLARDITRCVPSCFACVPLLTSLPGRPREVPGESSGERERDGLRSGYPRGVAQRGCPIQFASAGQGSRLTA